ncbi:hypothetical protein H310_07331 [Aphanomyces invadans]|uniref:Uncharacterized protein n=1 Tax=Aphanomyces invadans TaxID=157072 RepID=A0A024U4I5_9STRA|nr:hypothetical protein H310_07331 [Aphanomyces invadans]ETW00797.1 hypothetical protein H310_07331 [Aphanomyces invadans]|eukprot:XP_008870932.1 hypothetical protein H310_07331 [Aphanomyces invadans]
MACSSVNHIVLNTVALQQAQVTNECASTASLLEFTSRSVLQKQGGENTTRRRCMDYRTHAPTFYRTGQTCPQLEMTRSLATCMKSAQDCCRRNSRATGGSAMSFFHTTAAILAQFWCWVTYWPSMSILVRFVPRCWNKLTTCFFNMQVKAIMQGRVDVFISEPADACRLLSSKCRCCCRRGHHGNSCCAAVQDRAAIMACQISVEE